MAKVPAIRAEGMLFLSSLSPRQLRRSINEIHEDWMVWREAQGLEPAAVQSRTFRQMLVRLEELGSIRILREGDSIVGIKVLEASTAGVAERLRHLERERAIMYGRQIDASPEAANDLYGLSTPALNEYVRRRARIMAARRQLVSLGQDPSVIPDDLDPVGEEALALKERVLRLELELISRGGDLSFLAPPPRAMPERSRVRETVAANT